MNVTLPPDLRVDAASVEPNALPWWYNEAWKNIHSKVTGRTVKYANLDSGYTPHPDLPEPNHVKSYVNQAVEDRNGHGNHTIGISVGRNNIGVAPGATLEFVGKVLTNEGGGSSIGIARAIRDAADLGCDVVNGSFGAFQPDEGIRRSIIYLNSKGGIFVAAAGNSGFNTTTEQNTIGWPARFLESLCVGAFDRFGRVSRFSSGGRQMDVICPGEQILSAGIRDDRAIMSGTSQAAPFMSGTISLMIEMARTQGWGNELTGVDAVRSFLERFSIDRGIEGHDPQTGFGIPDFNRIVDFLSAGDVTGMSV